MKSQTKISLWVALIVLSIAAVAVAGPTIASICRHPDQSSGCPMDKQKMPDSKCCISELPAGPSANSTTCNMKMHSSICPMDHATCSISMKTDCPLMGSPSGCPLSPGSNSPSFLQTSILLL